MFLHLFFCHNVVDKFLTLWLVCLLSNRVPHGWFLKCVCVCVCACLYERAIFYVSVAVVVVVGTSCEVSRVIFCLVVGYGGRLNALASRTDAILCSVVSQPPLPCLSLSLSLPVSTATDHMDWQASFGFFVCPTILRLVVDLVSWAKKSFTGREGSFNKFERFQNLTQTLVLRGNHLC